VGFLTTDINATLTKGFLRERLRTNRWLTQLVHVETFALRNQATTKTLTTRMSDEMEDFLA
jgi:hypothetical protein